MEFGIRGSNNARIKKNPLPIASGLSSQLIVLYKLNNYYAVVLLLLHLLA